MLQKDSLTVAGRRARMAACFSRDSCPVCRCGDAGCIHKRYCVKGRITSVGTQHGRFQGKLSCRPILGAECVLALMCLACPLLNSCPVLSNLTHATSNSVEANTKKSCGRLSMHLGLRRRVGSGSWRSSHNHTGLRWMFYNPYH